MKVELSPTAADDLAVIRLFLEDAGSLHTAAVIDRLLAACEKLSQLPERGAVWRLRSGRLIRRIVAAHHLIFYEIRDDRVSIIRVLHAHRDLRDIFGMDEDDDA